MESLSAREAARRLGADDPPLLLDVREPWEVALAGLPHAKVIPLGQLPARLGELDPHHETIVVCHHGVRSLHACMFLAAQGFTRLANLSGGSEAWSLEVDPTVARY